MGILNNNNDNNDSSPSSSPVPLSLPFMKKFSSSGEQNLPVSLPWNNVLGNLSNALNNTGGSSSSSNSGGSHNNNNNNNNGAADLPTFRDFSEFKNTITLTMQSARQDFEVRVDKFKNKHPRVASLLDNLDSPNAASQQQQQQQTVTTVAVRPRKRDNDAAPAPWASPFLVAQTTLTSLQEKFKDQVERARNENGVVRDESGQDASTSSWTPTPPAFDERTAWELLDKFSAPMEELKAKREALRAERMARRAMKHKSIKEPGRNITVVTTASLPWMTGTAVNPLLRAAYLAAPDKVDDNTASDDTATATATATDTSSSSSPKRKVTLLVPWLSASDQERIYPNGLRFETPDEQEAYVRSWVANRVGFEPQFKLRFYAGRYAPDYGSILPVGDLASVVPSHEADVAVLEEPEHLNWYHHGERWTRRFHHVVGIVHTNYLEYARREQQGTLKAAMLRYVNAWVCRTQCHKVVKLSGAVQDLPRETTCFVHGVSPKFLSVGDEVRRRIEETRAAAASAATNTAAATTNLANDDDTSSLTADATADQNPVFAKGCYFIGKVLWGKGYTELVNNLITDKASHGGTTIPFDVYGSGPDLDAVAAAAANAGLPMTFFGARDHGDESLHDYKVLVNPSLSDVVATTTAEALAMGKFVVVAKHPSNEFFSTFPNALLFDDEASFSAAVRRALAEEPQPLSPEDRARLTWEAATLRFLDVADIDVTEPFTPTTSPLSPKSSSPSAFARVASGAALPFRLVNGAVRAVSNATDDALAIVHNTLTGVEPLRRAVGAGKRTKATPADLCAFAAEEHDPSVPLPSKTPRQRTWSWRTNAESGRTA